MYTLCCLIHPLTYSITIQSRVCQCQLHLEWVRYQICRTLLRSVINDLSHTIVRTQTSISQVHVLRPIVCGRVIVVYSFSMLSIFNRCTYIKILRKEITIHIESQTEIDLNKVQKIARDFLNLWLRLLLFQLFSIKVRGNLLFIFFYRYFVKKFNAHEIPIPKI